MQPQSAEVAPAPVVSGGELVLSPTTRFVNTTPHAVVLFVRDHSYLRLPADREHQLRLRAAPVQQVGKLLGNDAQQEVLPIYAPPQYTDIDGPVDQLRDETVLVSMLVGDYVRQHADDPRFANMTVLGPDTGPGNVVRGDGGEIVGTRALVCYHRPGGTAALAPPSSPLA